MFSKIKDTFLRLTLIPGIYFATISPSHAQDLGDIFKNLAKALGSAPLLLSICVYLIGILLVILGFMHTIKAKNFPQQASMGTGIFTIVVGCFLLGLPSIINAINASFGTGSSAIAKPVF